MPVRGFKDRLEAADRLARQLERYRDAHPLILGIPRGAVPMAARIAERLSGDLDVILVHKIGAPDNPEFAIGSVSEFGTVYLSRGAEMYSLPQKALDLMAREQVEALRQRRARYSPLRPPLDPRHRTVILADDGIATGSTMIAAIRAVRRCSPGRLVVAAPVASPEALEKLGLEADEVEILETPEEFHSVSQFYEDFEQVSDDEVARILARASGRAPEALVG